MARSAKKVSSIWYLENNFTSIYEENIWDNAESVSGDGSTLVATEHIRKEIPKVLKKLKIQTLLDAPCGDFNWMSRVKLGGTNYIGIDIVKDLISKNRKYYQRPDRKFLQRDLVSGRLPKADLIFCRDCIQHLPFEVIFFVLDNFKKTGAEYLLISNHRAVTRNQDLKTAGHWRPINLFLPPFNFPPPIHVIVEEKEVKLDLALTLWRLEDIPAKSSKQSLRLVGKKTD